MNHLLEIAVVRRATSNVDPARAITDHLGDAGHPSASRAPKSIEIIDGAARLGESAFNPDGSRLYFSSQRGVGNGGIGVTFEIEVPFRS